MRIGIDAHTVGNRRSGDESYTIGLVRGLSRIDARNHYTIYVTSSSAREILGPLAANFLLKRVYPQQRWGRLLLSYPVLLFRDGQDLVHFQYTCPPLASGSLVLTVHDISFRVFPEYFDPLERLGLRWATRISLARAEKVITVSRFSRGELIRHYKLPPEKVAVTYDAVADEFRQPQDPEKERRVRGRYGLGRDYLLYVGTFTPRKRAEVLIEAYQQAIHARKIHCDLVLVGSRTGMYRKLLSLVQRYGLEQKVKFLGYVPTRDLPYVYRCARALVCTSLYEGFGLPVLEAMWCGAPVICHRGSSLAEISQEAALELDMMSSESLAEAIAHLVNDEVLRRTLIHRGRLRAGHFSWDETARRTLEIYQEVLERRRGD